jgi:23S rRNA (cytidine1920-2'-O)/16S rRNA (cytidine1409-2'-O)-methyltransferase
VAAGVLRAGLRSPSEVRRRLDVEMVRRGIVRSGVEAHAAIRAGKVTVGGRPVVKAETLVLPDEPIFLAEPPQRFVSRGGEKLHAALEAFGLDVRGRDGLDAGASTGGFTDCLLARGAARVIAVDVGYGQLAWSLREDPRVTVLERTNVRDLRRADLPFLPSVVTADLSFISLRLAVPVLAACSDGDADFVLLVKPQFEAARQDVADGGVVRDPDTWTRAIRSVAQACRETGIQPVGVIDSPLLGPAGNAEFLLLTRRREARAGHGPGEDAPGSDAFDASVERAVDAAALRAERG